MAGSGYYRKCINHPNRRSMLNAFMCEECFQVQNEYLKTRVRDVETEKEDRLTFLFRRAKELGLNYTKREINKFIRAGMTDNLILKTKSDNVWVYGCEASKAMPVRYQEN